MSTRQPSLLRKAISVLASFALAVAFVPIAWADDAPSLKFNMGELEGLTLSYKIDLPSDKAAPTGDTTPYGETITVSSETALVNSFVSGCTVTIKAGSPGLLSDIQAYEGEADDAKPAYDGKYDTETGIYTFTASGSYVYVVKVYKQEQSGGGTSTGIAPSLKFENKLFQSLKFSYKLVLPEDTASAPKGDTNTYGNFVNVPAPSQDNPVMVSQFVKGSAVTIIVEPATANASLKTLVGDVKVREGEQPSDSVAYGGSCVFDDTNNPRVANRAGRGNLPAPA